MTGELPSPTIHRDAAAGRDPPPKPKTGDEMGRSVWHLKGALCLFAAVCATLVLGGCAIVVQTQWIEAPLVADASLQGSDYAPSNPDGLRINEHQQAVVRFSLDTLPNGNMVLVSRAGSGQPLQVGPSAYALTADKIARARIVVYVQNVRVAGSVALVPLEGNGCWPQESVAPACVEGPPTPGVDPDYQAGSSVRKPVAIRQPGFRSFDATDIVKSWVDGSRANNGIKIVSVPGADASHADFDVAAKESSPGKTLVPHSVQLLITLSDLTGVSSNAASSSQIQESAPGAADAGSADLRLSGTAGSRGVALLKTPELPFVVRSIMQYSSTPLQASLVTYASSVSQPGTLRLSPAEDFDAGTVSWNTQPAWDGARAATAPVAGPGAVSVFDFSRNYGELLADEQNANPGTTDSALPGYAAALEPDAGALATVDGVPNSTTARAPRATLVYKTPEALQGPLAIFQGVRLFDPDDAGPWGWETAYMPASQSFSMRIGQPSSPFGVRPQTVWSDTHAIGFLSVPVNVAAPGTGASATFPSGRNTFETMGSDNWTPVVPTANRVVGSYLVHITMPGHNARFDLQFHNLPLPVPALQGPSTVLLPAGQTAVSLPATAPADPAAGFVLAVDDAVVNAHIDNTTKWRITSSVAGDVLPGVIAQSDGSVGWPIGFASAGPRTLTVTSQGDASVRASMQTTVQQQSSVRLAQPLAGATFVYGQAITLLAEVTGGAGPPAGSVHFSDGAATDLGDAGLDTSARAALARQLPVGRHDVQAAYAGDIASFTLPSVSNPVAIEVLPASTGIALEAVGPVGLGGSVTVWAALAVAAPGGGTPTGTITITNTTDGLSCSYAAAAAAPGCSLRPKGSGTKALTASYSGDGNFLASSAAGTLVVSASPTPVPVPLFSREGLGLLVLLLAGTALAHKARKPGR
ncbi:Ig-like domain repeat protein [Acidovorax sp. sif1233]|uniref:Ig-like domain repeat protein n=1 Tax=Acidovorax sp. sif1233 TaxID=2854792 RepID=UPI001C457A23|nr:Ig-like domain repeat protein [Acidovorax sp. sif1233]MBV7455809.1 Ig-like domain repeat protein [Acidovorax sp. sif1233]